MEVEQAQRQAANRQQNLSQPHPNGQLRGSSGAPPPGQGPRPGCPTMAGSPHGRNDPMRGQGRNRGQMRTNQGPMRGQMQQGNHGNGRQERQMSPQIQDKVNRFRQLYH